jgi:hypothetical protein
VTGVKSERFIISRQKKSCTCGVITESRANLPGFCFFRHHDQPSEAFAFSDISDQPSEASNGDHLSVFRSDRCATSSWLASAIHVIRRSNEPL